jgi:hypothetical protein
MIGQLWLTAAYLAVGTVCSYIAYWLIAIIALVRMKHKEVRRVIHHESNVCSADDAMLGSNDDRN